MLSGSFWMKDHGSKGLLHTKWGTIVAQSEKGGGLVWVVNSPYFFGPFCSWTSMLTAAVKLDLSEGMKKLQALFTRPDLNFLLLFSFRCYFGSFTERPFSWRVTTSNETKEDSFLILSPCMYAHTLSCHYLEPWLSLFCVSVIFLCLKCDQDDWLWVPTSQKASV